MTMKMGLFAAMFAVLAACSAQNTQTAIQTIGVGLTAADTAAANYVRLPLCPKAAPICSDAAVSAEIKKAAGVAYAAYKAAEANPTLASLTEAAIAALAGYVKLVPNATTNN